jgi:protease-4
MKSLGGSALFAIVVNVARVLALPMMLVRRALASAKGGYVLLVIRGEVVDLPLPRSLLARLLSKTEPALAVSTVRALGRTLAEDSSAKGLLVRIRGLRAGPAVQASLREALAEIRAAGKDVVVHLPAGADTASLYVASAARAVLVGPGTMVAPLGYAIEGRYMRRALDRIGVEAHVYAKGAYKSAGEGFVRDQMSEPEREQLEALLEARHEALVVALAQARCVDRGTAKRWIDTAPHAAADAVAQGIVDGAVYDEDIEDYLEREAGPVRFVAASKYLRGRSSFRFAPLRPRSVIGVVRIHGIIGGGEATGHAGQVSEERLVAELRSARNNPLVRGVVLHIDSRGGSAVASNRVHHEVERLAEDKPVVAYLADVAASGGYYVASAAHAIVAQPQSITGSIGVVATRLVIGPLLDRLGVSTDVVKRGARADLFSRSRRFEQAEQVAFERELDAVYRTFLGAVAKGRGRTVDEIEALARGRIYSGAEARALGLVDHLGGFERALHEVRSWFGAAGRGLEPVVLGAQPRLLPSPFPYAMWARALGLEVTAELLELAARGGAERVVVYCPHRLG